MDLLDRLHTYLPEIGVEPTREMTGRFAQYYDILLVRNAGLNLVSRADISRIADRHFLESAGLVSRIDFPDGARVMDLGSGAGFPGVPVKIVRPDIRLTLLEPRKKRAAFLESVVDRLDLTDTAVLAERAEDLTFPVTDFDVIVCRAVAGLDRLAFWCRNLLVTGGTLAVLKGAEIAHELEALAGKAEEYGMHLVSADPYVPYSVQLRDTVSTLVLLRRI